MAAAPSNSRIKVIIRTRPTDRFAHDMIMLDKDAKVGCACV